LISFQPVTTHNFISSSFCISAAPISAAQDEEFGQDGQGQGGYRVDYSDSEE
jgi:hypothetical protein